MRTPSPLLLSLYCSALHLYPRHLRLRYCNQIVQTMHDAYADHRGPVMIFWAGAFADLFQSSLQEHLHMLRRQLLARPVFFHALILGIILTLVGGIASAVFQGMLRGGANQPQLQMSSFYATEITSGVKPDETVPRNYVDLQRSLEPFTIFYNNQGVPIAGNGYLNQTMPTPPRGVFDYLRSHKVDKITWQPQPDVRIASVIQHVTGPNPGFILTGRSLRLVEEQESLFWRMAFGGWFLLVFLLIGGAALLNRAQHAPALPSQ